MMRNLNIMCVLSLNKYESTFLKKVKEKCKKKNQKHPAHSGKPDWNFPMLNPLTSKPIAVYANGLTVLHFHSNSKEICSLDLWTLRGF